MFKGHFQITNDWDVGLKNLSDLCRIHIDMDYLRIRSKFISLPNSTIIEPSTQANDAVGTLLAWRGWAMHILQQRVPRPGGLASLSERFCEVRELRDRLHTVCSRGTLLLQSR